MIKLAVAGATGRMGRTVLDLASRDERFTITAALTSRNDPLLGEHFKTGSAQTRIVSELDEAVSKGGKNILPCDVLVDFTVAHGTMHWLEVCERRLIPMVVGATGHSHQQLDRISEAAHTIPIVKASNFSTGIQAIIDAVELLVRELGGLYDIEIVETHHRNKIDAPSGTALTIAEAIRVARDKLSAWSAASDGEEEGAVPVARPGDVGRPHERTPEECESSVARKQHPATCLTFGRHGRSAGRADAEVGIHAVRMGDVVGQHEIHFSGCGETVTLRHVAHSRETFAAGALRAAAWIVSKPPGMYSMKDVLNEA